METIDAFLQERLQERPNLAKRGIRLTRDVKGHILVYVGQERYRSLDQIPAAEVRAFIRETIRLWETQ